MGVNRLGQVRGASAHFDGQHTFTDEFAGARSNDLHTEDSFRTALDHQAREAVVAA